MTFTADRAAAAPSRKPSTDTSSRRRFAVAMAVALTTAATVPALAELVEPQPQRASVPAPQSPGVAFLSALMDDPKPASSADALAQGAQQLADKQYEEALATLQQAKADELDDAGKAQLSTALGEAEKAAGARKSARAAFEEGESALASGDNLGAISKYATATGTSYADAATIDKANTQIAVALHNLGNLNDVYSSAKADLDAGNLDAAKTKFWALDAVGYKAGLLNKSPGDYLTVVNQRQSAGNVNMAAAPNAADINNVSSATPADAVTDQAGAVPMEMSPAERQRSARTAYVAGREAYHRGDIAGAREQFARAAELNYRKGWGEAGPQKMLAEIDKKETADAGRAARAQREAEATAMASADNAAMDAAPMTPATPDTSAASTTPDATPDASSGSSAMAALTPADAPVNPLDGAVAIAEQPTAPSNATPSNASPSTPAMPLTPANSGAATNDNSLQATAAADRVRAEQNAFRARTYVSQGNEARAGSRYEAAIAAYDQALQLDPNNAEAQAGKAEVLRLTGRDVTRDDALTDYQKVINAKQQELRFTIQSGLEQSAQAREAGDFAGAKRALLGVAAARQSAQDTFAQADLSQFDAAILAETNAVNDQERASADARKAAETQATLTNTEAQAREQETARRNTIASLIRQARQLTDQGKYEDALKVIDQILNIDPRNDYATGVRPLVQDRFSFAHQRATKERLADNLTEVLAQAEEARVPIPDLLVYTPDWPDLSRTREETIRRERGGEIDQTTMALLAKPLPVLRFDSVPFVDVIEFLRDTTQANIFVNWTAIEGAGVDKNAPISARLTNVKFSKVLNIILESAGGGVVRLGYTIDDGVITISTQDELATKSETQTYDIRDLLVRIPDFDDAPSFNLSSGSSGGSGGGSSDLFGGGAGQQQDNENNLDRAEVVEQIIRLITDTIASDTWKENGGLIGAVQELGGQLIVTQTSENLAKIRDLLEKLRETRAIQVNVEARFLTVQRNFLEEIGVDFDFQFNVDYDRFPNTGTDVNLANPTSDFSPVLVRQNSVVNGANGIPSGFTSPGQLVTGLSTSLAPEAGASGYGLNTSISAFLDDFRASLLLRAVQLGQNATTLTAPRITLFNGQRAYVLVSTQQRYVSDLSPVVGTQAVGYDSEIDTVNSGVVLDVQATVSADRKYVTLTVNPQLSRLVALRTFSFAAGNTVGGGINGGTIAQSLVNTIQLPEVETTRLRTTVSVPDRGTLLLGGQTLMGEIERESGTPVLSKIPFLKRLFTNRGTAKDEQVLLILIKPTIIIQREVEMTSFPLLQEQ